MGAVTNEMNGAVHPLIVALVAVAREGAFRGTASELLAVLADRDGAHTWPKSPARLSRMIRWADLDLRDRGVEVTRLRVGHQGTRIIAVRHTLRWADVVDSGESTTETGDKGATVLRPLPSADGLHPSPPPADASPQLSPPTDEPRAKWPFPDVEIAKHGPGGAMVVDFQTVSHRDSYREPLRLRKLCEAIEGVYGRRPTRLLLTVRGALPTEIARDLIDAAYEEQP